MLEVTSLTYKYSRSLELQFPDLSVQRESAMLLCGESGCGKTTLLHLLAGLRTPTSGEIIVDNEQISDFSQAKMDAYRGQHIGLVHQHPYFIHSLSVLDNLMLSPHVVDKEKVKAIAERLQITEDLLSRRPNQLSSGQQQRVSIARAVINKPKLILADEPTSALDNKNCSRVIHLLLEEAANHHSVLLIATHDERLKNEIKTSLDLNPLND